jgi:aminoglycoside phosphotransferase (APT) family kinase protein
MATENRVDAPRAEGVRVPWEAVPGDVRAGIEARLGAPVVDADTMPGGFSPGLAARLRTDDGNEHFVKAVARATNAESVFIYRREARIASALPDGAPCPRLQWSWDRDDWVVLCFELVPGANPVLPWRADDLRRVLDAMAELAAALSPSPARIEPVAEVFGTVLQRWRELAEDPVDLARIAPPWRNRIDELVALEARWPQLVEGETLLHLDIRADNVVLGPDRVIFVDWPWAATGAPWVDLVAFLPSVGMQGGPDPEEVFAAHPLARDADPEGVDAFLAGFAGMLTRRSLVPPDPGLPTLRAFQAAQGRVARSWLARRRGWTDAIDC